MIVVNAMLALHAILTKKRKAWYFRHKVCVWECVQNTALSFLIVTAHGTLCEAHQKQLHSHFPGHALQKSPAPQVYS